MSPSNLVVLGLLGLSMGVPVEQSYNPQDFYQAGRIVGGTEAPEGSALYMVALVFGELVKSYNCGACVVSKNKVLTAAHCIDSMLSWIDGQLLASLRGQIGSNSLSGGYIEIRFSSHENHPDWNLRDIKNDVGLLELTEPLPKKSYVKPIVVNFRFIGGGEPVHVTGWGRLSAWGELPDRLQLLRVETLSPKECEEWVRKANELVGLSPPVNKEVEVCTKHERGAGHGMCNGDSGSPLVDARGRVVAVVSWGWACAHGYPFPDIYARMSGFEDWLRPALARAGDVIEE